MEKKVVVTLLKLMHSVSIFLVADKAALGKFTIDGYMKYTSPFYIPTRYKMTGKIHDIIFFKETHNKKINHPIQ
jgi:hypothetical protein